MTSYGTIVIENCQSFPLLHTIGPIDCFTLESTFFNSHFIVYRYILLLDVQCTYEYKCNFRFKKCAEGKTKFQNDVYCHGMMINSIR